jgi:hypothetical protein
MHISIKYHFLVASNFIIWEGWFPTMLVSSNRFSLPLHVSLTDWTLGLPLSEKAQYNSFLYSWMNVWLHLLVITYLMKDLTMKIHCWIVYLTAVSTHLHLKRKRSGQVQFSHYNTYHTMTPNELTNAISTPDKTHYTPCDGATFPSFSSP